MKMTPFLSHWEEQRHLLVWVGLGRDRSFGDRIPIGKFKNKIEMEPREETLLVMADHLHLTSLWCVSKCTISNSTCTWLRLLLIVFFALGWDPKISWTHLLMHMPYAIVGQYNYIFEVVSQIFISCKENQTIKLEPWKLNLNIKLPILDLSVKTFAFTCIRSQSQSSM
jgi:hypothetical protein